MRIQIAYLAALVVGGCPLHAAQPNISNIGYDYLTHSSVRIKWDTDIRAYFQVKFGVTRGTYPYASHSGGPGTAASLAIGGLKPGTTYFFRAMARPNKDDDTDICDTNFCGSVELMVTTPPEPAIHPELPSPPAERYSPAHPDTSGYTVISLQVGPNGDCVGASDGASLQTILNNASYGTVIEFPQGATCKVFPTNQTSKMGYRLPAKPVDPAAGDLHSPNHRWIVLRTAGRPEDFPPQGVRITPAWSGKVAKLVAQVPSPTASSPRGQVFEAGDAPPAHHYWIENLEFTHTSDASVFPPDAFDPQPFYYLIRVISTYTIANPIEYIVLDRIYVHGTGFPGRLTYGVALSGGHQALMNSWIGPIDTWLPYEWPTGSPALSSDGKQMTVPQSRVRRNAKDAAIGMTGPATVNLSASDSYAGRFVGYLGAEGLSIQYTADPAVTITCTGCTALPTASPTAPYNRYQFFAGTIAHGQFSVSSVANANYSTTAYINLSYAVQFLDGGKGPYTVSNNRIDGYGMSFYNDAGGSDPTSPSPQDVFWQRNHLFWDKGHLATAPESNGFFYLTRSQFEVKRAKRWLLDGNIFEGAYAGLTNGIPVFFSGREAYNRETDQGIHDITFTNNIIRHATEGFSCTGMSAGPDPGITNRVLVGNNLFYDINQWIYDANSWQGRGHLLENLGGCQDMTVRNNTFGLNLGVGPYQMMIGVFGQLAEGLRVVDNIMYLSYDNYGGNLLGGVRFDDSQPIGSHPRVPSAKWNGTDKEKLDTYSVRIGDTVAPSYTWANNVIIGGTMASAPYPAHTPTTMRDMTAAEVQSYMAKYPPGNFFPGGETVRAREAQVMFTNADSYDYRLRPGSPYRFDGASHATTGGSIGANQDDVEAAIGLVKNVGTVRAGTTSAVLSYTAPDGNGCSVDTSRDGAVWSRVADAGGTRQREVVVSRLLPSTIYKYRILCYYEQTNEASSLNEYPEDQITTGEFRTAELTGAVRRIRIRLPALPGGGAKYAVIEYGSSPALGASADPMECAAGCFAELTGAEGSVIYYRWKYIDENGVAVQYGNIQTVLAR